jgi:hypothetical protein
MDRVTVDRVTVDRGTAWRAHSASRREDGLSVAGLVTHLFVVLGFVLGVVLVLGPAALLAVARLRDAVVGPRDPPDAEHAVGLGVDPGDDVVDVVRVIVHLRPVEVDVGREAGLELRVSSGGGRPAGEQPSPDRLVSRR